MKKQLLDDTELYNNIRLYEKENDVSVYTGMGNINDLRTGVKEEMANGAKDKKEALFNYIDKYPNFIDEKVNIVKKVCKELGITQKELAERLDVSPSSISDWVKGSIPKMAKMYLELLIETKDLKEKFEILKKAHKILSE